MTTRLRSGLMTATLMALAACGGAPIPPAAAIAEVPKAAPIPDDASRCQDGVIRLLDSLREPMTITVHATKSIPELDAAARRLEGLLQGYARRAPSRLAVRVVAAETAPERIDAKEDGVMEGAFAFDEGREARGFLGLAFRYRDKKEAIPLLDPRSLAGIEHWIANRIRGIAAEADGHTIRMGLVTGKLGGSFDEPNLVIPAGGRKAPTIKGIFEQAIPYYTLEPVSLDGGDLDPGLRALIVTQPAEALSDAALARIDRFLMLGDKGLLVLAGATNLRPGDGTMSARLDTHRLETLLQGYGVELGRDVILDWGAPATTNLTLRNAEKVVLPYPAILDVEHDDKLPPDVQRLDSRFPVFFHIDAVAMAFTSTLKIHAGRQPEARIRVVARSSPKATVETADTVALGITSALRPAGEYAQRDVAVTVEGRVRSAFPTAGAAPVISRLADRILVISAAQFAMNPYARAGSAALPAGPNTGAGDDDLRALAQPYAQQYLTSIILALKNSFDWMTTDGDDVRACSAMLRRDEPRAK